MIETVVLTGWILCNRKVWQRLRLQATCIDPPPILRSADALRAVPRLRHQVVSGWRRVSASRLKAEACNLSLKPWSSL